MRHKIVFIDRALRPNEKSHYKCSCCGAYLHPDLAYSHRCKLLNHGLVNKSYDKKIKDIQRRLTNVEDTIEKMLELDRIHILKHKEEGR